MDITYNLKEDDLKQIETIVVMQMMLAMLGGDREVGLPDKIHAKVMEVINSLK